MPLLPDGFALPPLPYLLTLLVGIALVGIGFSRRRPSVTSRHVLALAPWIVVGSSLHVLYVIDGVSPLIRPFTGTPAVYLTVAAVAGGIWLLAESRVPTDTVATVLAVTGGVAVIPVVALVLSVGASTGGLSPLWPVIAVVVSVPVTVATWMALTRAVPRASLTGPVGLFAVFGHAIDAVSTAIGIDVLEFGERTPLSRWIMEAAAALPTAETIGVGWLFVLIKLLLISVVVVLFVDYVEDAPTEGYLLLGVIAAVGLGPGVHNLLLFTVAG